MIDKRIKQFLNKDITLFDDAKKQLDAVLRLSDIYELVVLPDVHSKEDSFPPKGIVALTKGTIYPFLLSNELGCGIRVFKTDLFTSDFDEKMMDSFFSHLKDNLQDSRKVQKICSMKEYGKVFTKDLNWLKEKFSMGRTLVNLERHSSFLPDDISLKQIFRFIPKSAFEKSYSRLGLGSVGSGNHFLEMQAVDKVLDEESAKKLGLKKGQIIFMFHTGGKLPLQLNSYYELPKGRSLGLKSAEKKLKRIMFHFNDFRLSRLPLRVRLFLMNSLSGIPSDSPEADKYLKTISASLNFCLLNRCIIMELMNMALDETFKRSVSSELISDTMHESLDYEAYKDGKFWVHRNGGTKVYNEDLIPLPGFMGGPSFICISEEGVNNSRHSLGHGVGRNFDKEQAKDKFKNDDIYRYLHTQKVRLYRLGNGDLREQAPFAFKDIYQVLGVLKDHRLSRAVCLTQPLGILKG